MGFDGELSTCMRLQDKFIFRRYGATLTFEPMTLKMLSGPCGPGSE